MKNLISGNRILKHPRGAGIMKGHMLQVDLLYWPENDTMMKIQDIKKVELHFHIDQLLNQYILMELQPAERYKKLITGLEQLCPIGSISDWLENYGPFIDPVVSNNGEFLLKLLELYLIKSKQQNVIYSEIMLSGFTFQHDDIDRQIELYRACPIIKHGCRNSC